MTQVATGSEARPTIGDILLAHGFVTSEDLAAAIEQQQRSGQPLGQILVERGSITRLVLASALAEQWSASPATEPPPTTGAGGPPPAVVDDDTYATRVQAAVSDLARRVGVAEPLLAEVERRAADSIAPEELDARLSEVTGRIELSHARVDALEFSLTAVAERLEEMTESIERAFSGMQSGTGELAERLTAVANSVVQQADAGEITALQAAVESLVAERHAEDPALVERLDDVTERLATGLAAIEDIRAALADLGARPAEEPSVMLRVEELEQRLAAPAEATADLRAALADAESRLAETSAVESRLSDLEQRLETLPDQAALDALGAEVRGLAAPPETDSGVVERLEEQMRELRAGLDEIQERAAAVLPDALAAFEGRLAEVADPERLAGLEAQMGELSDRSAIGPALMRRVDGLTTELEQLQEIAAEPDPRIDAILAEIGRLAAVVDDVVAIPAAPEHGPEIDRLWDALDELGRRGAADEAARQRLEALAAEVTELAARPSADSELAGRVDELAAAVNDAAGSYEVARLRAEVEMVSSRSAALSELEEGVAIIARRLEGLDEAARGEESAPRVREKLLALFAEQEAVIAALSTRLWSLEAAPAAAEPDSSPSAAQREDIERQLQAAFEAVEERGASASQVVEEWREERERMSARLDELAAGLERAASVAQPSEGRDGSSVTTDRELERQRMAIERLGLHLGEHERALAEVMRSRGVAHRVDELAAQVERLAAAGGTVASGEMSVVASPELHADLRALARRLDDAEASVQADREKLLTRLDRMASSIDWRLQRLEAGEQATDPTA